ncbi:hypothetical protein DB346_16890 [Verrucomicrobia bacterium LW23]|nr:hypothetical protein DB346_16890 [Verrucomicrobia bacterium LW23]
MRIAPLNLTLTILLAVMAMDMTRACAQTAGTTAAPAAPVASPQSYGPWRSGHIGGGGYIIAIIPTGNPQIYYLHTDVGGFYRSDDGGANWHMLHGSLPATVGNQQPRGLVVDPRDPNCILVATGSHWEAQPDGIYRSSDGGKTFERTLKATFAGNGNTRMWGSILSVDPSEPDIVLAASMKDGVFRSADFGRTWQNVGLEGLSPTDIDFDKTQPGRVLLCAQPYNSFLQGKAKAELRGGLFFSEDGGVTWREMTDRAEKDKDSDTPTMTTPPCELLQAPPAFGSVWLGVFNTSSIRQSKDGGRTWQDFGEGLPAASSTPATAQSGGDHSATTSAGGTPSLKPTASTTFTAMAAGPDFLLLGAGDGKLYRRNPSDAAWTRISPSATAPDFWYGNPGNRSGWVHFGKAISTLMVDPHDPTRWWLGDWYMLWQSTSAGKEWNYAGNGIEVTVVHNVTQVPDDPGHVHLGMADNGYFYSQDGGSTYKQNWRVITNNIKDIAVSAADPARTFAIGPAENGPWHSNQLFVSDDRGATWRKPAMQGLRSVESRRMNSLASDPANKDRVYIALAGQPGTGGGIYQSDDAGETWKSISTGMPDIGLFQAEIWHVGRELAASKDGSLVAISSYKSRIFRRAPGSETWTEAARPSAPIGKINSVEADPFVPGRYIIASPTSGVHESRDGGVTWTRLSLEALAHHVTFDKAAAGRIAVGTSDGVALSTDSGKTWRTLDKALPNRIANSVAFAGDRIVVGTGGCGTLWIPLNEKAAALVSATHFKEPVIAPDKQLLKNGNFDSPAGDPLEGWTLRWSTSPDATLQPDTSTYASKPAALELKLPSEATGVAAYALPEQLAEKRIKVTGKLRVEGAFTEVFVAIQSFDEAEKQISWINILDASKPATPTASSDWQSFDKTLKLSPECAHASLVIHAKGTGSVWLDDVSILQTER